MATIRRRSALAATAALLLAPAACTGGFGDLRLRIAAGNPGGVYDGLAQTLATAWQGDLDIPRPQVLQTEGSPDNVRRVLAGEADVAFVAADVAEEQHKTHLELAALARIHDDYLHVVVRADSGIRSMDQLRGHRIAIGAQASGVEFIAAKLLAAAGLNHAVSTSSHDLEDSIATLLRGDVDAFFWSGGLPTPKIVKYQDQLRLVDIGDQMPKMRALSEVYGTATIPASTYDQRAPVTTLVVPNFLVVRQSMNADVAEALVRGLFDARGRLAQTNRAALSIDVHPGIETQPLPLHPGALRYFRAEKT